MQPDPSGVWGACEGRAKRRSRPREVRRGGPKPAFSPSFAPASLPPSFAMAPPSVDLATTPILKLCLHAAKYPASPVCGVLLGRADEDGWRPPPLPRPPPPPSASSTPSRCSTPAWGWRPCWRWGCARYENRRRAHARPRVFPPHHHSLNLALSHHSILQAAAYARSPQPAPRRLLPGQ